MKCDKELKLLYNYHIFSMNTNDFNQYSYSLVYKYILDHMLLWKLAYINYLKANFEGG